MPLTQNFYELILPMIALGFSIGAVDCSMLPELAHLVDIRHAAGYASAYVIGDLALCLGDAFGKTCILYTLLNITIKINKNYYNTNDA